MLAFIYNTINTLTLNSSIMNSFVDGEKSETAFGLKYHETVNRNIALKDAVKNLRKTKSDLLQILVMKDSNDPHQENTCFTCRMKTLYLSLNGLGDGLNTSRRSGSLRAASDADMIFFIQPHNCGIDLHAMQTVNMGPEPTVATVTIPTLTLQEETNINEIL